MNVISSHDEHLDWIGHDQGTRLVRWIIFILLATCVPLTYLVFFSGNDISGGRAQILPGMLVTAALSYWLLHSGRLHAAVGVLLWGMWLTVSIQSWLVSGIRTPATMAYPVLIMAAGWLLGRRNAWLICAASLVWLTLITAVDARMWPNPVPRTASLYWITLSAVAALAGALSIHIAQSCRRHYAELLKAHGELATRLAQLEESEGKFATLFHLNPVPVSISLMENGTYHDVSPSWEKISGWSRAEALGKTSTELGIWITPEEREAWITQLRSSSGNSTRALRLRTRDGAIRHFISTATHVHYDKRDCIFAAFVDVTDQRSAEEALRTLNAELEQRVGERTASLARAVNSLQEMQEELVHSEKLASLGALVAGIAHELNTPVGNALLLATTLCEDTRNVAQQFRENALRKSSLEHFLSQAEQGSKLLEQSLHRASDLIQGFKQVAVDQASERRRQFDLAELVRNITETLRPGMRHQPWQLEAELTSDLSMDSFPGPLGQVITNLVQNAVVHAFKDAETGTVRIATRADGADHIELCISDDGVGIHPDHIGRIFDPFFTTRLGQGGSGLGLNIVHRLVTTVLGGQINVTSWLGEGSTFIILLPRKAPVAS